jgi:hypothetical protein
MFARTDKTHYLRYCCSRHRRQNRQGCRVNAGRAPPRRVAGLADRLEVPADKPASPGLTV